METKSRFLSEVMAQLSESFDLDLLKSIEASLLMALKNYEISDKCEAIAVRETESEKYLRTFLATKKLEGRSEKTIERYRYILARYYSTMLVPFKDTDVYTLRLYLAQLEQDGCSDNTINGIRCVFSSFFGWLHNEGFIDKNPTSNLGVVKCKKVIRKPYSNVELEKIRDACVKDRDRAIIEFLLSTGCRIEETTNLNIQDINFITQEVKVLGKGNKERIVFLNDVACLYLNKYLNCRSDSSEALFVGKGDKRLLPGGVRAMLKTIEEKTGVENIHPHRFRRTLATSLIDRGMAIQDVAAILGHANINTTTTYIYTDVNNVKSTYKKLVS